MSRRKRYDSSSDDDDDSDDESTVSGGSSRGRSSTKSRKLPEELVENSDSRSKSKKLEKRAKKESKKKKKEKKEKKRRKKEKKKEKEKEKRSKSRKNVDVSSSDYDSSDSDISVPDKSSSVSKKSAKISAPITSRNQVLPDSTIVSKPSILKKESSFVDSSRPVSENTREIKKSKVLPVVEPIRKSSSTTTATESTVTTPEEAPYQHHRANTVVNVSNNDHSKEISLRSPRRTTAEENPRQSSTLPPAATNPTFTSSITIDNIRSGFPTIITTSQPHIVKIVHIPGCLPQILCVCSDNVIYRYNLLNGQPLQPSLVGHADRVTCLSVSNPFFAPNSRTGEKDIRIVAASGSSDGIVRIWDLSDGRCIQLISAFPSIPCWAVDVCVRFNGQISLIASGGESAGSRRNDNPGTRTQRSVSKVLDDVILYDAISGKKLQTFVHPVVDESIEDLAMRGRHAQDSRVTALLVHQPMAAESLLVTAGTCTDIFVWSLNTAVLLCILRGHVDSITSLAISSFASSSSSSSAKVTKEEIPSITSILDQPLLAQGAEATPPASLTTCLISSSKDATIRVWDLRRGRTTYIWTKHRFAVQSVSATVSPLLPYTTNHTDETRTAKSLASPGTPLCVSVGDDGTMCTWNVATGRLVKRETQWHQGLSAITKLTPTTYLRHVDTAFVPVTETPHAATPVEQRVLIATCAWNNSVQCHELYQDVLRQSKMCRVPGCCVT